MPGFVNKLAGAWSQPLTDALLNYQFYNPNAPQGLQQAGNLFGSLIGKGSINLNDETGNVSLNPLTGQIEIMGKNLGFGFSANQMNPSAELKFRVGQEERQIPMMMNEFMQQGIGMPSSSPAREELEQNLKQYRSNNQYWYRP